MQRALLRRNLDFGDAPLTPLPISATKGPGMVTVNSGGRSDDFVETIVPTSKAGWQLHLLTPVGGRVRDAATTARFATAAVLLFITLIIAEIIRRQRHRAEQARKGAADRALLEAEVEATHRDLRQANKKLHQEMSERKAGEAKLQQTRDQLVQANKLASLGQITAGVAHEINQPVAAIRTYADNGKLLIEQARPRTPRATWNGSSR